jgi:hypothetical protein
VRCWAVGGQAFFGARKGIVAALGSANHATVNEILLLSIAAGFGLRAKPEQIEFPARCDRSGKPFVIALTAQALLC